MTRRARDAAAAALALGALGACGGSGAAPATIGHRPADATLVAPSPCPPGVTVDLDLDGDGRDDHVVLSPDLEEVTCLAIVATTAPPLVCRELEGDFIIQLDHESRMGPIDLEPIRCDPMGAALTVVKPTPPPPATDPGHIPTGRTFQGALVGSVAPSGTGLWLDGGDAYAAIIWRDGWRWFIVGA